MKTVLKLFQKGDNLESELEPECYTGIRGDLFLAWSTVEARRSLSRQLVGVQLEIRQYLSFKTSAAPRMETTAVNPTISNV